MAGTVQRLIRHIWGFLNNPADIENKQQSFNEGDNGSGRDRTQLVAKGPTGILHEFRCWDETTDYVTTQFSVYNPSVYIPVTTIGELNSAAALSYDAAIMITEKIFIDELTTTIFNSNKKIYALGDDYLSVENGITWEIETPDSARTSDFYIDFYCKVNNGIAPVSVPIIELRGGMFPYKDFLRFTDIRYIELVNLSNAISSRIYYQNRFGEETGGEHYFWSPDIIHGKKETKIAQNFIQVNKFGPDNGNKRVELTSDEDGNGYINKVTVGDLEIIRNADGNDDTIDYEVTIPDGKMLHNDGVAGHLGIGKDVPTSITDFGPNFSHGSFFNLGSVSSTSDTSEGKNATCVTKKCYLLDYLVSSYRIKILDSSLTDGEWSVLLMESGFKFYKGYGTAGDVVNLTSSNLQFYIDNGGHVFAPNTRTGTTQAGAGATTNEIWCDTDDDRTLKLGA